MAMTGHKDLKLADHFSKSNEDDQKEVSMKIFEKIREYQAAKDEEVNKNVLSFSNFAKQA